MLKGFDFSEKWQVSVEIQKEWTIRSIWPVRLPHSGTRQVLCDIACTCVSRVCSARRVQSRCRLTSEANIKKVGGATVSDVRS